MWFMGSGIATRIDLNEAVAMLADTFGVSMAGRRQMGAAGKDDGVVP